MLILPLLLPDALMVTLVDRASLKASTLSFTKAGCSTVFEGAGLGDRSSWYD